MREEPATFQHQLIELPLLRFEGHWRAVCLEESELAGVRVWAVTVGGLGRPIRRRWFPAEDAALCCAANLADEHEVPLIDLRDGGDGQG